MNIPVRITKFLRANQLATRFYGDRTDKSSKEGYEILVSNEDATEIIASLNKGEPYEGSFNAESVYPLNPVARYNREVAERDYWGGPINEED